jgi:hypothetical protein
VRYLPETEATRPAKVRMVLASILTDLEFEIIFGFSSDWKSNKSILENELA